METKNLRYETETTYIAELDRTIIWREVYLGDEPVQTMLVGWYYGEPDEKSTETFSFFPLIATYEFE